MPSSSETKNCLVKRTTGLGVRSCVTIGIHVMMYSKYYNFYFLVLFIRINLGSQKFIVCSLHEANLIFCGILAISAICPLTDDRACHFSDCFFFGVNKNKQFYESLNLGGPKRVALSCCTCQTQDRHKSFQHLSPSLAALAGANWAILCLLFKIL